MGRVSKRKDEGKLVVKRPVHRIFGLFIDGIGLDRATRRLNRRVDIGALARGVTSGIPPVVARYYTLIPHEDDSRHHAFLDAVSRAGFQVVVKRLPPKGVNRQVSIDPEMAADMVAFALGHSQFSTLGSIDELEDKAEEPRINRIFPGAPRLHIPAAPLREEPDVDDEPEEAAASAEEKKIQKVMVVVCPSRELVYPISLVKEFGADTVTADFSFSHRDDVLKSAAKWIDLSNSETIWKD